MQDNKINLWSYGVDKIYQYLLAINKVAFWWTRYGSTALSERCEHSLTCTTQNVLTQSCPCRGESIKTWEPVVIVDIISRSDINLYVYYRNIRLFDSHASHNHWSMIKKNRSGSILLFVILTNSEACLWQTHGACMLLTVCSSFYRIECDQNRKIVLV